ncbi:hypothetical protein ACVWZA_001710 [Sphingomonas sp. UYAg733]
MGKLAEGKGRFNTYGEAYVSTSAAHAALT